MGIPVENFLTQVNVFKDITNSRMMFIIIDSHSLNLILKNLTYSLSGIQRRSRMLIDHLHTSVEACPVFAEMVQKFIGLKMDFSLGGFFQSHHHFGKC